jgi:hypothetical protein
MQGDLRFTRVDTGHAVELAFHAEAVARPPELKALLPAALRPDADAAERQAFAAAWQGWVRTIVVEHADDPALVSVVS